MPAQQDLPQSESVGLVGELPRARSSSLCTDATAPGALRAPLEPLTTTQALTMKMEMTLAHFRRAC